MKDALHQPFNDIAARSLGTWGWQVNKRFAKRGIPQTEEARRRYRELLTVPLGRPVIALFVSSASG